VEGADAALHLLQVVSGEAGVTAYVSVPGARGATEYLGNPALHLAAAPGSRWSTWWGRYPAGHRDPARLFRPELSSGTVDSPIGQ